MIGRVAFDGSDVTDLVIRRGIGSLTAETQNEEGAQTMGSAKITFNNLNGAFDDYGDTIDPVDVEISTGSSRLFKGTTDPENSLLSPDGGTFSCECTSEDRYWLDTMKQLKMSQSAADVDRVLTAVLAETSAASDPINVEGRFFWSLKSLIEHLTIPAVPVSIQITGKDLGKYYVGGRQFNIPVQLPDTSAAQLVKSAAALFNAMYFMQDGTLVIRDRKSFIDSADTPLSLPYVRGSLKQSTRRCGLDRVKFDFANADANELVYQYAYFGGHAIIRDPQAISFPMNKEVASIFLQANTPERIRFSQPWAFISRNEVNQSGLFLMYNDSGNPTLNPGGNVEVNPTDVLSWYDCEFRGLMEWEATFIVMDNEAALAELIKPLRRIAHPLGRKTINVVRSVTIDLDAETAAVRAMEFIP